MARCRNFVRAKARLGVDIGELLRAIVFRPQESESMSKKFGLQRSSLMNWAMNRNSKNTEYTIYIYIDR